MALEDRANDLEVDPCMIADWDVAKADHALETFGEGWLDWSYFRSLSTERSTDPGGEGRIEVDLGPFTLTGGGGAFQALRRAASSAFSSFTSRRLTFTASSRSLTTASLIGHQRLS